MPSEIGRKTRELGLSWRRAFYDGVIPTGIQQPRRGMTGSEIDALFERLGRLVLATKNNAGAGTAWSYTFPDGETHNYFVRGLRSHEATEDSALNLLIWVWNAKDYLKKRAVTLGQDGALVEKYVDAVESLAICADLANHTKHGGRDRPARSKSNPRIGKVSFTAPQTAAASLTFKAYTVEINVNDPPQVEFSLPVLDESGQEIGDAFIFAKNAIQSLERLRDEIERAV